MTKCTLCKRELPEYSALCHECFEKRPRVRVFSRCGPCLRQYRHVRTNRTTVTVAFRNGSGYSLERAYKGSVHEEPCPSCEDHPRTQYPDGYMD